MVVTGQDRAPWLVCSHHVDVATHARRVSWGASLTPEEFTHVSQKLPVSRKRSSLSEYRSLGRRSSFALSTCPSFGTILSSLHWPIAGSGVAQGGGPRIQAWLCPCPPAQPGAVPATSRSGVRDRCAAAAALTRWVYELSVGACAHTSGYHLSPRDRSERPLSLMPPSFRLGFTKRLIHSQPRRTTHSPFLRSHRRERKAIERTT